MICLRCGYCCKYPMAIIVDDPDKGCVEGNLIFHEGNATPCKHLTGNKPEEYNCSIHNRDWYPETPCFSYSPIGRENANCRMGVHIINKQRELEGEYKTCN